MSEKTKAYLKIAAIVAVEVFFIAGIVIYKSWWIKVPFIIFAGLLGAFLVRMFLAAKRKKHLIQGKVLSVTPPKKKFGMPLGKTQIVIKSGKASKKLCSMQKINLKLGHDYAFYYEEKSNEILKYEELKMNMASRPKGGNVPPQYRF
ncbi:MAG: hypothetical protein ACRDA4_07130 [Filifactoraceae bacterium]